MTKEEIAKKLFKEGYNCAQSVVGAYKEELEELGIPFETLMKLSSSFGGGMGKLREVCGAVTGMFMVIGLKKGYVLPEDFEGKTNHYNLIQTLAEEFKKEEGTIICRELLGLEPDKLPPSKRDAKYYQERPCENLVGLGAKIVEKYL